MKTWLKSFLLGYIPIPLVFYSVDMICQELFVVGELTDVTFLTLILVPVSGFSFWLLLRQRKFPVDSPWAALIGGAVGLWHFFTPYMIIGSYWIWKTIPANMTKFSFDDLRQIGMTFVNPALNWYNWQCDGSATAVILSLIVFVVIVIQNQRKRVEP